MTDRAPSLLPRLPIFSSGTAAFTQQLLDAWWPNVLLFVLTLASTTLFGCALAQSFAQGRPVDEASLAQSYLWLVHGDKRLVSGLTYSLPLLTILLAHELGHYFSCRRWNVSATLPYFGPSPTLLGTIGAFIWIRTPIYNRRSLFDIGVSGPLCGFVVMLPFLAFGVGRSQACPGAAGHALFSFGTPPLLAAFEHARFPGVPPAGICLHPMAVAAWAGLLATAMNLLPIGQLDGGHILYGLFGARWHALVSACVIFLLLLAGFLYWPWWIWALGLFFFRQHPFIYDDQPLDAKRRLIGALALVLLLVSFVILPVKVA